MEGIANLLRSTSWIQRGAAVGLVGSLIAQKYVSYPSIFEQGESIADCCPSLLTGRVFAAALLWQHLTWGEKLVIGGLTVGGGIQLYAAYTNNTDTNTISGSCRDSYGEVKDVPFVPDVFCLGITAFIGRALVPLIKWGYTPLKMGSIASKVGQKIVRITFLLALLTTGRLVFSKVCD